GDVGPLHGRGHEGTRGRAGLNRPGGGTWRGAGGMDWIPDRYRELRSRLRPERLGDDVAEEIEHHLSLLTEDYIRRGMAPDAARRAAVERFGDVERYRAAAQAIDESHLRERRRMEHLDAIRRELRHALRGLARSRSFTI